MKALQATCLAAPAANKDTRQHERLAVRTHLLGGDDVAARAELLSQADGLRFSLGMGLHLGAWGAGLAAVVALHGHWGWQALLTVLLGTQLHALTVLQHDCGHRSAYAQPAANLWVGRALAWFIFMPFSAFTELHRWHHGFLGDARRDPDEWFYEGGPRQLFLRECLFMPRFVWLSLTRWPLSPAARWRVRRELLANVILWSALIAALLQAGHADVVAFGFLMPMLWLALVFNPISRGFEHYPMACMGQADPRRRDLRFNTITVTSPLVGLLWAHITCHVEHHVCPRVPFHRLQELRQLLKGRGQIERRLPLQGLRDFMPPRP